MAFNNQPTKCNSTWQQFGWLLNAINHIMVVRIFLRLCMWPRWCARAILPRATQIYDSNIRGGQREIIRKELVIDHSNLTMKDVDRSAIAGWSASGCDPPPAGWSHGTSPHGCGGRLMALWNYTVTKHIMICMQSWRFLHILAILTILWKSSYRCYYRCYYNI